MLRSAAMLFRLEDKTKTFIEASRGFNVAGVNDNEFDRGWRRQARMGRAVREKLTQLLGRGAEIRKGESISCPKAVRRPGLINAVALARYVVQHEKSAVAAPYVEHRATRRKLCQLGRGASELRLKAVSQGCQRA